MSSFQTTPNESKNGGLLFIRKECILKKIETREKEAAEIEDFLVSFFETKKRGERVVIWYFFNLFFI